MGQSFAQNRLPFGGGYSVVGTNATFSETDPKQGKVDGESFRMAWRTILNYMWRGNGIYTWNPSTHQFAIGTNTAMKDNALKLGAFLKDNGICASLGSSPDPVSTTVKHKGIAQMRQYHLSDGTSPSGNWTNYTLGTSSPSAVASGDETLIAELYRQLELKWDDENTALGENDTIIVNSTPKYFHGWFRLLGMMTLTGNLHAPENMVSKANMKVYVAVNKTFAFVGDDITYTVDYRNYGADNASNTQIVIPVSSQYEIIDGGGGSISGSTITFNIGTVPGFASTTGITPTKGSKTIKLKVKSPKSVDRVCLIATISCSNGTGWISNEYPNNATYSMQRNCVDILGERALKIVKTSNKTEVNPQSTVDFTLNFENSTSGGWLNGGRKNVNFSYAYAGSGPNSYFHLFRNWNNAQEAYINLSNYRASFFMFDNVNKGIYNATTNPSGWTLTGKNLQTGQLADFDFKGEKIPVGSDVNGKWDQRIIIRFPSDITAPTHAVLSHLGNRFQLHKGTLKPIWYSVQMESNPPSPLFTGRIQDDWSYISTSFSASVGSGSEPYFLIGPNYADYNSATGVIMDRFDKDACSAFFTPDKIYNTILVEEFDGYAWRRVAGEGPLPGREIYNVTVLDTIPSDFQFVKFIDDDADGTKATLFTSGGFEIIKWSVPKVLVGMKGDLKYQVKVKGACPGTPDKVVSNKAWFSSDTDSPIAGIADVKVTCAFVPPPISGTTMFKKADKTSYLPNDNINYSIKLIQTLGTISIPPTTDATRWTAIDGTASDMPKFTPTGIDFDNNKPGIFIRENYSHGKNGTLIAEVDNDGQEMFGFVFRYTSGNRTSGPIMGLYLEVQLAYFSNQANIKLYQNGTVIGSLIGEAYAAPYDKAVMKVELTDGVMKLWINDISGLPITTFSGITNQSAGFVGFAVGDKNRSSSIYSKPKILNWNSHFDSAFDVQVSDPIPAGTTFVSATGSGFETAGRVTWPKILGPMLYGDSVKYTLITKVGTSCPSNGKIINMSYVNLFGIKTDSIGAQSVATCGGPQTCTFPSSVLATNTLPTACAGQSVTLKATVSPSAGSFKYQWYKKTSGVDPTKFVSTYTDYLFTNSAVADTGIYVIRVTDANDLTCFKESQTTVVVNPISSSAAIKISAPATACENTPVTVNVLSKSIGTIEWFENGLSKGTASNYSFTAVNNVIIKAVLTSSESCASPKFAKDTISITVDKSPSKATITTTPKPLIETCLSSLQLNATTIGNGVWSKSGAAATISSTGLLSQIPDAMVIKVFYTVSNGVCIPSKDSISVQKFASVSISNVKTQSQVLCKDASYTNPKLIGSAIKTGESGTWEAAPQTLALIDVNTGQTSNLKYGTNKFYFRVKNQSCNTLYSLDSVTIKLDSLPAKPNAGPDQDICTTNFELNATNSINKIKWTSDKTGVTFVNDTLYKTFANNLPINTPTLFIISAVNGACQVPAKDTVSITSKGAITTANVRSQSKSICETDGLPVLAANSLKPDESGTWKSLTIGANINNSGTITSLVVGNNEFLYTISSSVCTTKTSIDTVLIIKDQLPSKPNAGPDQNICTTNFDLNVGISKGKIKWSSNQPGVSIANDTLYKTAANNLPVNIITIFTVSAVNGACKTPVSDTVAVTAKGSLTKANVKSQSSAVCSDIALPTLNGNNKQPGETSKWASLTSGAFIDSTGKIKNLVSGINKFEYSISGSTCPGKSKDTVILAVKTKPVALISSPTSNDGTYKTQLTSVSIQALSDPNIGFTGKWEKSGQGVLNNTSATLNDLSGLNSDGITKVYWIVSENTRTCQPDTAVIYIEKVTGDYASAGIDTTVCESSLPVLKGTGSKSGIWKALTTQTVINQNGNNANVVSASSVTVNQYSYCVTSTICDTVNITVKKADIPSVSIFPSPSDKNCEGDSVWLRIDQISPLKPDIFTYIWKKNYAVINNETSTQYKAVNWKDNDVISLHIKAIPGKACFNPDTAFAKITLKLIPVFTPSVTIYSDTTKLNCEAHPISFKIKNKQGQGLKPIYNWLYNNQEFGNDSVFFLNSWKNGDNVELKMRSNQQCAKPDTSSSNVIILKGTPRINSKINLAIKGLPEGSIQCKNAPVNLEAKSSVKNVTYNWTDGTNISTDSTFSKILSSNTVINLTATSKPGCYLSGDSLKETQTVTISIADPVEINLIYDETENCKNAPQVLTTSSKGNIKSYKWFINDQLQTGKNLNSEIFTYLNFHDIVTVEGVPLLNCNNGIYTDTARVNVYDKPINGFANGDNLAFKCYLEPITLLAKESNVNYTYNWSRNGISQPSLNNSLLVLEEGKYQLQISNNSCLTKSEIEVKDNQVSVKIVTDHTEFLPGETLDAEAIVNSGNTNGITYSWSPNNIVTIGNAFKTQVIPIETVLLKVNVTTTEGCKGKDSLLLKKKDKLFIPNAITPGVNEINAYWGIKGTENYPDLDIKVFNRWGTLVHEQKGYSTPWDGTINGKALPTGTYYYVIKDPKSNEPFVGDLTIVR